MFFLKTMTVQDMRMVKSILDPWNLVIQSSKKTYKVERGGNHKRSILKGCHRVSTNYLTSLLRDLSSSADF